MAKDTKALDKTLTPSDFDNLMRGLKIALGFAPSNTPVARVIKDIISYASDRAMPMPSAA